MLAVKYILEQGIFILHQKILFEQDICNFINIGFANMQSTSECVESLAASGSAELQQTMPSLNKMFQFDVLEVNG